MLYLIAMGQIQQLHDHKCATYICHKVCTANTNYVPGVYVYKWSNNALSTLCFKQCVYILYCDILMQMSMICCSIGSVYSYTVKK